MSSNGQDHDLISGTPIRLGVKMYVVPPLNLEGLEKHEKAIEQAQSQTGEDGKPLSMKQQYDIVCDILLDAIRRNYPEIEMGYLKKVVDLGNAPKVFQAVLGQSGYAQTGEELASE